MYSASSTFQSIQYWGKGKNDRDLAGHHSRVKSLGSSLKDDIHVELNSHADTSVVGSNVLFEHYVDVYDYDS